MGMTIESIYKLTGIDPWFIHQMEQIVSLEIEIQKGGAGLSDALLRITSYNVCYTKLLRIYRPGRSVRRDCI